MFFINKTNTKQKLNRKEIKNKKKLKEKTKSNETKNIKIKVKKWLWCIKNSKWHSVKAVLAGALIIFNYQTKMLYSFLFDMYEILILNSNNNN